MGHLDDLPTRTSEHVGETESRDAFRGLFKDPLFIIRREDETDYGTDYEVEVQFPAAGGNTFPANIRFHAQLKASTKDSNKDGSFSYSVDRTNLNYLLNCPRSIYVFYARDSSVTYYRWAEDVLVEYEKSGSAWRSQASVTVRFHEVLDPAAVTAIHKRMIEEAPRERDLRLAMRRQGVYMSGAFAFDPETTKVTDQAAIAQMLSRHGLWLASHGHVDQVLQLVAQLPPAMLDAPMHLSHAYAAYLVSRVGTAFEELKNCDVAALHNDNDRALHAFLAATLRRSLGITSHEEYVGEVGQIETRFPNSVSAIYANLERLRLEGIKVEGAGYAEKARALSASLQARGKDWAPLAVQADFVALELRYHALQKSFREQVFTFRMTEHLGVANATIADRAAGATALGANMRQWLNDFELALKVAEGLHVDILVAEGLYVFSSCMLQETLINDKLSPPTAELQTGRKQQLSRTIERLEHACTIFEKERAKEQWVRTQLLIVEGMWLKGEQAEAVSKAAELEKVARQEALVDLCQRASRIAAGESPVGLFDALPPIFEA